MKKLVAEAGGNARAASVTETAQASDVILLSTPWPATREAIEHAGPLAGKILIDATNPLSPDLSGLEYGNTTSGGEQVAAWASGARVVKAFNTVGFNIMANPKFSGGSACLFFCGDDGAAKQIVRQLASEIGFDPRDAGPLTQSRVLEPLALLWISLALKQGYGREFALGFLGR